MVGFTLSFQGNEADEHKLDLYDASQALIGFQRSLAITTHLILNGEIITQAPALKNAKILAAPPREGSWELTALIICGVYKLLKTPKDSVIGHLIYSAYDYIISETLGFHVDYDTSLGQKYDELQKEKENNIPILRQSNLDSAVEKCENSVKEMHRPIAKSKTALQAKLLYVSNGTSQKLPHELNIDTYEYMESTTRSESPETVVGLISSYNINTYKGRVFVPSEGRPLSFQLDCNARDNLTVAKIVNSLSMNATDRFIEGAQIHFRAYRNTSKSGQLKSYYIVEVEK